MRTCSKRPSWESTSGWRSRAERLQQAAEYLARDTADVILLDLALPDSEGLATLERAIAAAPHVPIIIMTGLDDESVAIEAVRKRAQSYLVKGEIPPRLLLRTIHYAVERKRLETALAEAKAAAEAANAAKSRFLANISHELRTPMNAILGMVDLALPRQVDPTAVDFLQTAKASADLLLALLDDLLDSAKIEAGKLELELAPFSLRRVLDQTTQVLAVRASERGIAFSCRVAPEVPDVLVGDQLRLRQVLLNLAGNGIKFTQRGEVTVRVDVSKLEIGNWRLQIEEGEREGQDLEPKTEAPRPKPQDLSPETNDQSAICNLQFAVSDTGIGIPRSDLERIFRPFAQADPSTTRRFGGTGLGLAICTSLVGMMGGRIWAESGVGKGSTFYFAVRLPLAKQPPAEPKPPIDVLPTASAKLQILLVEDNPANQKLAAYILRERGHSVDVAADGRQALRIARRTATT